DLGAAGLREGRDEDDALRLERFPELVRDCARDLERERLRGLVPRLEDAEDPRDFALHGMWISDRGGFGDRVVRDGCRLELRRADALARDVERVVRTAVQEPVAVFVDRRPVAV